MGSQAAKRFMKMNRVPEGEPWFWLTREIIESEAWSQLSLAARRVIDRILVEHMGQGGKENGRLIVTYDDFQTYGIRRQSLPDAIALAVKLGFVDVTTRGRRSAGHNRTPSTYGITWLPRHDWAPASNRWKAVSAGPLPLNIEGRCESAPRENGGKRRSLGAKTHPVLGAKTPPVPGAKTPLGKKIKRASQQGSGVGQAR